LSCNPSAEDGPLDLDAGALCFKRRMMPSCTLYALFSAEEELYVPSIPSHGVPDVRALDALALFG